MPESSELIKMVALGLVAGVCSGLFGIGGGLIIVPALVLIFGFGTKTAIGTSLFVILLPTGLLGVLEYWRTGEIKVSAGLCIAFGVFCGAYFGAVMAGAMSAIAMKRMYAVFLLIVAVYFLLAPAGVSRPPGCAVPALPDGIEACAGPSNGPLTARLVLVDRPDKAVGIAQGEFAPAPVLIGRFARDAQDRTLVHAMLVKRIHVGDLDLEMNSDADARVGKLLRVRLLGMQHQGERTDPQDGQSCTVLPRPRRAPERYRPRRPRCKTRATGERP